MKLRGVLIAAALTILAASGPALALPPGFARQADALLASSYPADGPGASVVITDHGKIVYQAVSGLADVAAKRPITSATVFEIGSITKQFVAATVLQLAAEGKIKLSDPIATYLPTYPNGRAISIAQLLNHTSGIPDYTEIPGWMVEANLGHSYTTQQLTAVFKDLPAASKPGEKWAYSSSGYILVGAVIEAVTHKPWYTAVEKQILQPLGLLTMRYGIDESRIANMATGYTSAEKGPVPSIKLHMSVPGAAGALVGTPSDLAVWANALHHGQVLTAPYYARMIAPTKLPDGSIVPYGFGIENGEVRGHPTIGHGGETLGFSTNGLYLPRNDIFVAVYSNSVDPVDAITLQLAAMAVGAPYPTFTAVSFDAKKMTPMLGVYKFKDVERIFGMRDGKLFTKRDGVETVALSAGQNRFFYGPKALSWFAVREDASGKFLIEFHGGGSDEIEVGVRTGPVPSRI